MENMINQSLYSQFSQVPPAWNPGSFDQMMIPGNKMAILPGPSFNMHSPILAPPFPAMQQQYLQTLINRVLVSVDQLIQKLGQLVSSVFGSYGSAAGVNGAIPYNNQLQIPQQGIPMTEAQLHQLLLQDVNAGLNKVVGWGNSVEGWVDKGTNFLSAIKDGLLGIVSTGASIFGAGALSGLYSKGANWLSKIF